MTTIYRQAQCVLIWLGIGTENTMKAMDVMAEIASSAQKYAVYDAFLIANNFNGH